jgi:hypothetical protein
MLYRPTRREKFQPGYNRQWEYALQRSAEPTNAETSALRLLPLSFAGSADYLLQAHLPWIASSLNIGPQPRRRTGGPLHPNSQKPTATLTGTVEKIIKPAFGEDSEKAEIVLENGEPLYREIRIENKLKDSAGKDVRLKPGAPVEVVVETDDEHTEKKA